MAVDPRGELPAEAPSGRYQGLVHCCLCLPQQGKSKTFFPELDLLLFEGVLLPPSFSLWKQHGKALGYSSSGTELTCQA